MTFENLHICNATNSDVNTDPEGVYINGVSRDITFRNCKVYNIKVLVLQDITTVTGVVRMRF